MGVPTKLIRGLYLNATSPGRKYSDGWSFIHWTGLVGFKLGDSGDLAEKFIEKFGADERLATGDRSDAELQSCCREMMDWVREARDQQINKNVK